jgi:LuxR family transcriptional regulator, quorum-sensing system regulator BjaR1
MSLKNRLRKTWDYIERIGQAADTSHVEACLLDVASGFGLTSIFGGVVPEQRLSRLDVEARILLQHFPDEWARRYNDGAYVFRDPVVHRLKADRNPFSWDESYESCPVSSDVKLIKGEASAFGLREGYVIPVVLLDDALGAVSFGGSHMEISDEERAALGFATNYAIGRLLQLRSNRAEPANDLTPREFDCLLWAAEGKTDWEISVILGISKSTVVKHIVSARDKLGAVNKAHAIAIALRDKLIQ